MNDGLANAINERLPLWAKYEGYATRALQFMLFTVAMAGAALLSLTYWSTNAAWVFAIACLLGGLFSNYYRGAAKLRVRCNQCSRPCHGEDECPHCGGLTYMQGDTQ